MIEQPLVRHDNQCVNFSAQCFDSRVGVFGATLSLDSKRPGNDTNGQSTETLGDLRDNWSSTGSGTSASTSCDKNHVRAAQGKFNFFFVVFCSTFADHRVCSGSESAGKFSSNVEFDIGFTHDQVLSVGVYRDELNSALAFFNHSIDGVTSGTTDANNLDYR